MKPIIINELEAGKAIPDNAVLGKLERELKIKLRGSNIGAKLEAKAVAKKWFVSLNKKAVFIFSCTFIVRQTPTTALIEP